MNNVGADDYFGNDSTLPGVLASKLMPPADSPTHLARPQLVETILGARNARLVLVRAAAGFGKTTLMQQYAARCRDVQQSVVWMRVDAADNDLLRFLTHLEAGVEALPASSYPRRGGTAAPRVDERLPDRVLERVACCTEPFSILLDDFEAIQSTAVLNFVQRLIATLPPGGLLVIASRATPELGLGRIRARGELVDIHPAALRFTLDEATAFIRNKCALPLGEKEIATLHRCTEGWATAIYLATLSLRTRSDHAAFVASFSGTNLELAEYLAEDILARQSESCRTFLLDTSVLTQLSAPLCNAITGRDDGREMLDYLERSNLFLVALDGERNWYRYYRLFNSFLRHRLHVADPARERQLQAAAAHWYVEAGRPVPAIDHLVEARLFDEALTQIAQHAGAVLGAGRIRLMVRWLDRIPAEVLATRPRIGITYAWMLLLNRRYADATQTVQRILAENESNAEHENLTIEADAIRSVLLALNDQVDDCIAAGLPVIDRLPPDAIFPYCSLANSLVYSLVSMHRYDEARAVMSRALLRTHDHPFILMRAVTESLESMIDLVQGRLGTALARLETASSRNWNDLYGGMSGGKTSIDISRASVLYETNAVDEANRLLLGALPYARGNSPPDALISSHLIASRIAYTRGENERAMQLLTDLELLGRTVASARLMCSAWLERARVATLEGRYDVAGQALRSAAMHRGWDSPDVSFHANDMDYPALTGCRLDIAQGHYEKAAGELHEAVEQALARQRYQRVLKLRLLQAMALAGMGDEQQSFAILTEALRTASHEGFLRTFVDEGGAAGELIRRWAAHHQGRSGALGIMPGFVERLLAAFQPQPPETQAIVEDGTYNAADALTTRELDVLRMLSSGHRNRIIAEKLFISELTVKSHLRKINAKLGAQNRTQAVAIGRTRGLIQ
ncbi:LuxR C-terminal-related transcriptional regulator [Paraburkholderia domus]|uniref:LuxR C-terminal-related transcriptional regulator n=1 Tax=Paraburkholderia domus TaxID=2793075 RepID=UPI001B00CDB9|nr:LuxR C-terminal-related transcriptional regulator [Paraburkholderia domus]CAE6821600.1 HTH-type transcriptional regulator MalT [Paraburkholderia domus]